MLLCQQLIGFVYLKLHLVQALLQNGKAPLQVGFLCTALLAVIGQRLLKTVHALIYGPFEQLQIIAVLQIGTKALYLTLHLLIKVGCQVDALLVLPLALLQVFSYLVKSLIQLGQI